MVSMPYQPSFLKAKSFARLFTRVILFLIVLLLILVFAAYFVSSTPANRSACVSRLSVTPQEQSGLSEDQAASLVLHRWLDGQMLQHLCPAPQGWITGYSVEEEPHRFQDAAGVTYPVYVTTFSVRPLSSLAGGWDGAGEPASGGWVRNRTIFFTAERDGGRLVFHERGTSPL